MWRVMGLVLLAVIFPQQARLGAQGLSGLVATPAVPEAQPWGALVRAAEAQVGVTLSYDPA